MIGKTISHYKIPEKLSKDSLEYAGNDSLNNPEREITITEKTFNPYLKIHNKSLSFTDYYLQEIINKSV